MRLADVEVPGDGRFDHHVVRLPLPVAGTVVADSELGVLMLYRHRLITDTWGWELPAGRVEAGETAEVGAAREVLEETGWRPGPLRALHGYHPSSGPTDLRYELFLADGASRVGQPSDPSESSKVTWVPVPEVRRLLRSGEVADGLSLTGLLWWLTVEQEETSGR